MQNDDQENKELEDADIYLAGLVASIVEKHYQQLFDELVHVGDVDFEDLVVSYTDYDGRTIRISWKERENRLPQRDAE